MVREITIEWSTANGGPATSVLYFDEAAETATAQRGWLNTFLTGLDSVLSINTNWTIPQSGREFNTSTGVLTGLWTSATPYNGGGSAGPPLPDLAQILVRWRTTTVSNGRFVQGRTFIPGCDVDSNQGGEVDSTALAAVTTAAINFVQDAGLSFGVWSRPVAGSGGVLASVGSADVWNEFASQRRRRS